MIKLQFNSGHHISCVTAKILPRISGRMNWWIVSLMGNHWKTNYKKKSLVFGSLATNTKPLKFYTEVLCFLLRGQKGTIHSKANE